MEKYYCTDKRGLVTVESETTIIYTDDRVNNFFEPTPDGYRKAYDENGLPFNELIPEPTAEELSSKEQTHFRSERTPLLLEADIEINKLEDAGSDSTAWRTYRQALRDSTIDWVLPTKP